MTDLRIDSHKLAYHPERVVKILEADSWEQYQKLQPIYAEVSTSGACNHRCTFCSVDYIGYKPIFLSLDTLRPFLRGCSAIGLKSIMFAGDGEPLLNPEIGEIVQETVHNNINVSFTTNAVRLDRGFCEQHLASVTWIKASVNAGSSDLYTAIHRTSPTDFQKVWTNLASAAAIRQKNNLKTALGIQSLLLPENILSMVELADRASSIGLDYLVLKPYVHNVYMNQPGYQDIDYTKNVYRETISILKERFASSSFSIISRDNALTKLLGQEARYTTCYSTPSLWFYVSGNGDVYACGAHVGNENFLLGNIFNSTIENIWASDSRKNCLDHVLNHLDLNSCRRTCRMDESNKYLFDLKHDQIAHLNFI